MPPDRPIPSCESQATEVLLSVNRETDRAKQFNLSNFVFAVTVNSDLYAWLQEGNHPLKHYAPLTCDPDLLPGCSSGNITFDP